MYLAPIFKNLETMKKLILVLASIAILFGVSCREEKTKTEKVIIEKQVEKPNMETPKEDDIDGTSLNIDKEGVEFSNKKGDKKTEVNIK